MIYTNRKTAARHFDNKRMLLSCLLALQCTFKGAKSPSWAGGNAGVKENFLMSFKNFMF